jgi:LEA14-like dessication related protein
MKKNCISPILLCLLTPAFLFSCKSVKDPELKGIEKVRFDRFGLIETSMTFDMLFFNPNNYRLKLKKANGDAWMDGNLLGHFTVDTLIHIPAKGDFRLPVQLKMDMSHIVENMSAAFQDKQVALRVDGMAKAGKGPIFINYPIRYEGKQKLSELMK